MNAPALRALTNAQPRVLADLIRPEFCVDLYLPPRENAYLYGQHCAVTGCERPGNDLIVDSHRLCQRHAQRFKRDGLPIGEYLAAAPVIAARSDLTGLPRYDLTAAASTTRDELRFLLQAVHDGQFSLTFSSKRWNALRAIYATGGAASLIDIDLSAQPPARVANASGKRFQQFLRVTRDRLQGVEASHRDDVWPRSVYECFAKPMQGRPPRQMDFTAIELPWLRAAAKEIAWQRMGVEGIAPQTAFDMVRDVLRFAQWAGDRLRGPQDITRRLLVDWLIHSRQTTPPRALCQQLSRLRLFLEHARVNGLAISTDATYLPGELAIRGELDRPPKYFDDSELAQLDAPDNLARLNDYNRRAYLVLRHTGIRTRSLVHLPFECLRVVDGAAYLTFFNTKRRGGSQEHTIPISPDLADVVSEQQRWVRSYWPDEQPTWLFPARNANPRGDRPAHTSSIGNTLVKWVRTCGIQAGDGQDLHFWPHRLRHTLGTQMINDGVPQRAVQDYYGHASPEMTAHYAKLLDQTLRREIDAFRERVNRRGERIEVIPAGLDDHHGTSQGAHRPREADAAQRLLRHPDPEQVPAPQRLPVLRRVPDRRVLPPSPRRAARPRPPARRQRRRRRPRSRRRAQPRRRRGARRGPQRPGRSGNATRGRRTLRHPRARSRLMGQPAHLAAWQAERRDQKRDAIRQAIRTLDTRGAAINFAVVAEEARVDRSWLYSQTDLAVEIRRLRDQTSGPLVPRPQAERASDESLRARLAAAHQALSQARDENRDLRADIRELREELARLHGERWEPSRLAARNRYSRCVGAAPFQAIGKSLRDRTSRRLRAGRLPFPRHIDLRSAIGDVYLVVGPVRRHMAVAGELLDSRRARVRAGAQSDA